MVRGLYTVQNGRAKNPTYTLGEKGINSIYASADVSWNKTIYISGTGRKDWFSTLSTDNNGILYPSVSGSYVFTETLNGALHWLNFGKVRLGYAEVGSDADVQPYADQLFYNVNANTITNSAGSAVTVGTSGAALPNKNLRPMRIKETEAGLELKMFQSRVNVDVAVYKKITLIKLFRCRYQMLQDSPAP